MLQRITVEGATGLYDTNYENKVAAALDALRTDDFVYLHIEASDEAGHEGNVPLKIMTIENLDSRAVGPIYEAVKDWEEPVAISVLPSFLIKYPSKRAMKRPPTSLKASVGPWNSSSE